MNRTANYELTILVPIYNEIEGLEPLGKQLSSFLPTAKKKSCVLLVDDGSNDGSLEGIKKLCKERAHFFYIQLAQNGGLSAALKAGIDYTDSPYVGYIDADLQTAPEDFNVLLDFVEEYELVTGVRAQRKDSFFKNFQSKVANSFRRMMTNDGATDTGCPLKIMHTDLAKQLPLFTGMHRFFPALIQLLQGKVKELPVQHFPRETGTSKYHLWNRLWSPFVDCFAFRWMRKRVIINRIADENVTESAKNKLN